jgi:DHA1 family multidrug resistance protein-like MFS transporter
VVSSTSLSWQKSLYAIWLTELVAIAGTNAVLPILPLYLPVLGVQGEQQVRIWAGLAFSASAATMAVFSPIWGALSDRYGRKMMALAAMLGGSLCMALMGSAQSVYQLIVLRGLEGALAGMIIPAASTLVATIAPHERAGYALGMLRTVLYVGASIGPLLGGLVADSWGYRATFRLAGALLLSAALGVWLFVEEEFQPVSSSPEKRPVGKARKTLLQRVWGRLAPVLSSSPLLIVLGMRSLMRLGFHATRPLVPLLIQDVAAAGVRVASASGLVSAVSMATGALGAVVLGRLGDRVGHRGIMAASAVVSAVFYLAHFSVDNLAMLLFLQAGTSLAMSGILVSIFALLTRVAPGGQEGTVYGVDQSVDAIVSSIGPVTGSALAASLGLRVPFVFAAAVFGLGSVAAARLLPRR